MLCLSVHDVALLELQAFHGDVEVLQETCNSTSEFITRFPLANAVSWHTSRRASLSFVEELSTVSVANLKDTC